jgi:hypothetical protein
LAMTSNMASCCACTGAGMAVPVSCPGQVCARSAQTIRRSCSRAGIASCPKRDRMLLS